MNDQFILLLQAKLESEGIKADYNKLKQMLEKDPAKINTVLDLSTTKTTVDKFIKEYAPKLKEMFQDAGVNVDINVKDIESALRSVYKTMQKEASETKKAYTELRKEAYQSIGQKSPELQALADYYNEIAKQAEEAAKTQQEYFTQLRREAYQSIGTKSPELEAMAKYYSELEKTSKANEKLNNSMEITKIRAEAARKSFNAYLNSLKPEALNNYATEINEVQNAFLKAQETGDKVDYSKATASLNRFKAEMKEVGMETSSFSQILKENISAFLQWYTIGNLTSRVARNFRQAINTIKEVDTFLTEISKTSEISAENLKKLGIEAFDYANKYGVSVQAYLAGVQEMSRAGYDESVAKGLAELSILAQAAGDMTAELANEYLIATNAAYKFNGDVNKLNAVLDSQNQVSNRNAITLSKLAEATKIVGSQAAASGVDIDELTAAITTMGVVTQSEGSVLGRAFKGILMNLQQVKGELDNGEIIDEDSFSKVEKAANALGVELKEIRNGVLSLRDPMQILRELAEIYSSLSEGDVRKANLLSALGGKYRSNELNALLSNWSLYEKVLNDYQNATGSAAEEAKKTADSIEGRLNKLTNTWNQTVAKIIDSDILKFFISAGTGAIELVDDLNILQTALIGLGGLAIFKGSSAFLDWINNSTSSVIALGNAINSIKTTDITKDTTALANALSGLTSKQMETVLTSKALENAVKGLNQEQIEQILLTAQLPPELAKATAATIANTVATNTATGATLSFKAAWTGLTAAIKANPIGFAIGLLTTAYSAFSLISNKLKQNKDEILATTRQVVSESKQENEAIESQIQKYKELHKQLNNSNLSTSEAKSIKDQLYSIQQNLIKSYQLEAEGLDLVNGKYQEQVNILNNLSKQRAEDFITKNLDTFNEAKKELEKERTYTIFTPSPFGIDLRLKDFIENYNNEYVKLIKNTYTGGGRSAIEYGIKVVANVEEAEKTLKQLYLDIEQFGKDNNIDVTKILENISEQSRNIWTDELNTYKSLYNEYTKQQIIYHDTLGTLYSQAIDAIEQYDNAIKSGKGINEAVENIKLLQTVIKENIHLIDGSEKVFDDLFKNISLDSLQISEDLNNFGQTLLRILNINKEVLDDYQESLKKIQNALKSEDLSSSEIVNLMQEFTDFDWESYGITGEKGVGNLTTALNALATQLKNNIIETQGYNRALEAMYEEAITASIGIKDLSLVEDSANRKTKLSSEQVAYLTEKYSGLTKYLVKVKDGWYLEQEAITTVQSVIENLKTAYVNAQKEMTAIVETEAYKRLSSHGIVAAAMQSEYEFYQALASTPVDFAWEDVKEVSRIFDLQKQFKDIFSTPPETKTGSGYDDFSNSIDWATQSIQNLQNAVNEAQDKLSNTIGYDKQTKAVNNLISAQEKLKKGYQSAADSYKKQYDSITGISNYKKLIESGTTFYVTDFTDKDLYEKVKKAQELWNNYRSSLEKVRDTEQSIVDINKKLLNDRIKTDFDKLEQEFSRQNITEKEYYEKRWKLAKKYYEKNEDYLDEWQDEIEKHYEYVLKYQTKTVDAAIAVLENKKSDIQNAISEREAQGKEATEKQNQKLIDTNKQLIEQYNILIAQAKEELSTLKKGTEAYAEKDSELQKLENARSQLIQENYQIEQEALKKIEEAREKYANNLEKTINKTNQLFKKSISRLENDLDYLDEDSSEYFTKISDIVRVTANQAEYLKTQINLLTDAYKAGNITSERYSELLEEIHDALDDVSYSTKDLEKSMASAFKANYQKVLDDLADSYKKLEETINDNYEAYEKIIKAKKEALRADKEANDYARDIEKRNKEILKIQQRIAELTLAVKTGDKDARKELEELQDKLAEKQEELIDKQRDYKIDQEEKALDKSLDLAKDARDKQLDHAKTVYETKMEQLKNLYAEEEKLINRMTQYASGQFGSLISSLEGQISNIINEINSLTGIDVSGVGSGIIDQIRNIQPYINRSVNTTPIVQAPTTTLPTVSPVKNEPQRDSFGLTQAQRERIMYLLTHGEGKDYGENASQLAAYTRDKFGKPISKKQALEIAQIFKIDGINSVDDITANDFNKNRILSKLIEAGFKDGGLIKATGEDGIALVKRDELIVNQAGTKIFTKELAPLMKEFTHDFNIFKTKLPDITKIATSKNLTPVTVHIDSLLKDVKVASDYDLVNGVKQNLRVITNLITKEMTNKK